MSATIVVEMYIEYERRYNASAHCIVNKISLYNLQLMEAKNPLLIEKQPHGMHRT